MLLIEILAPKMMREAFTMEPVTERQNILTNTLLRRGDVGIGRETNYIQDLRYSAGYVDVQRYGVRNDFCRIVTPLNRKEDDTFFACALAGTAPASTVAFRTPAVKDGFTLSRDDYMRDIMKDGRDAYCRILRGPNGFLPQCRRAMDKGFSATDDLDPSPPEEIQTLLTFYEDCEMWLRLRDDMVDYIGRAIVQKAGDIQIDETPRPPVTKGLHFNGSQFLRIGDGQDLAIGSQIKTRTVRAFSIWARFDEFTNNAHLFDFGDGAGNNNVFLGILGQGDVESPSLDKVRRGCDTSTVPAAPSGAQFCPELRSQDLLEDSAGNVDEYVCTGPEIMPRRLDPIETKPVPPTKTRRATQATLIYEVWDKTLRKVQIKINRAVPLDRWVHIVVTATNMDAVRPQLKIYVDGVEVYTLEDGALPQASSLSNNYLGKSNWASGSSLYELRDELFKGSMFDFRMYSAPLRIEKIDAIHAWGKKALGI
jgi:Concanavalin A-like lectin/glucanases superfamily